jgi:hypothetical protein
MSITFVYRDENNKVQVKKIDYEVKKIEKALDYLCSGVLYDSEILENEHSI